MRKLKGWIGEQAELCILRFSRIIEASGLVAIGSAILEEDWHKDDWGPNNIVGLSSPDEQCLDLAFTLLGEYSKTELAGDDVAVVCDPDEKEHKIEATFQRKRIEYPSLITVSIILALHELQVADPATMLR